MADLTKPKKLIAACKNEEQLHKVWLAILRQHCAGHFSDEDVAQLTKLIYAKAY